MCRNFKNKCIYIYIYIYILEKIIHLSKYNMLQIKNYVNSSNTSTSRSVLFMPPYINKLSYSNSSRVQTNNHHACIALL